MDEQKYEINVKRFIQSTEYQLKKLADCIAKLNEFQSYEDWRNVKQAQLNASQIIRRIKSDIKEIEKIRKQIVSQLADKSASPTVNKIDEQLKEVTRKLELQTEEIDSIGAPYYSFEIRNQNYMIETNHVGPNIFQYDIQKNEFLAKEKDLCDAYKQLQKAQKPTIDQIEKNIDSVQMNVQTGASNLKAALNYKTVATAASGALVGTIVGGPIGFFAGAKIGAIVGLGTGLVGFFVAKRVNSIN